LPAAPPAEAQPAEAAERQPRARGQRRAERAERPARATQAQRRVADVEGANLPLVRADKLVIEDINLDLAKQTFDASAVSLVQPQIAATRDYRGQLLEMARIWAVQSEREKTGTAPARPTPAPAAAATNGNGKANAAPPGWKVRVGKIAVDGGAA